MREMRHANKPEGKTLFGRLKHGWDHNIKMYLTENERENVDWIHLAQGMKQCRVLMNKVMKFGVH
jgi:hypothetical protein